MPIYALGDVEPDIHPDTDVHPDAAVIGNVTLGAEASVRPIAVLRGDGAIVVGARTSIQDGTIVHRTPWRPTVTGAGVTVGRNAHIECATVGDGALVLSGSVVLNGAVIGEGAIVSPNSGIPARSMALGVPARVREGDEVPAGATDHAVDSYVQRGRAELRLVQR